MFDQLHSTRIFCVDILLAFFQFFFSWQLSCEAIPTLLWSKSDVSLPSSADSPE